MRPWALLLLLIGLQAGSAAADELLGERVVSLETGQGERVEIGRITFSTADSGLSYDMAMTEAPFENFFLSMRPFRCIDGDAVYCHLEYPYEKQALVSGEDFSALEYDLLFIVKAPSDYGIDPFHGRYFRLARDGVGGLRGALHAVDLGILAVPPEAGVTRPIGADELDEIDLDSERYVALVIE